MVISRFNKKFHTVHDLAAICHWDDLPGFHVRVKRSMMGCRVCPDLTLQLSPPNDFMAVIRYDGPYDHMDRDELSTTSNCRYTLVISMFFKVTVLAAFGREKRLLESSNSLVAYSGFGVWCRDSYEGLEEVLVLVSHHYPSCHRTESGPIVLVINARTISA